MKLNKPRRVEGRLTPGKIFAWDASKMLYQATIPKIGGKALAPAQMEKFMVRAGRKLTRAGFRREGWGSISKVTRESHMLAKSGRNKYSIFPPVKPGRGGESHAHDGGRRAVFTDKDIATVNEIIRSTPIRLPRRIRLAKQKKRVSVAAGNSR
ncbi:MAG: hypothetical protein V1494_00350 [Candidatus Diapherotrites archaeon]